MNRLSVARRSSIFSLGSIDGDVATLLASSRPGTTSGLWTTTRHVCSPAEQRVGHQGVEHDPLAGLDLVERLLEQVLVVRLARLVPQAGAQLGLDRRRCGPGRRRGWRR